ncbi:uncharacterized protein METZ01_LOCUS364942, partial [marine metagenome]
VNPKYTNIWCILLVEVAGIEPAPSNCLQDYEIITYYSTLKTLMVQV